MNDSQSEDKPKKIQVYHERKIFINNMNSFLSKQIIEVLRTDLNDHKDARHDFMGTVAKTSEKLTENFFPKITEIDYDGTYNHEVFDNDVFIFDLNDSFHGDADYLIKGLKTNKQETEKTLILISNIMVWGRTPANLKKEKEEPEEEEEKEEKEGNEEKVEEQEESVKV